MLPAAASIGLLACFFFSLASHSLRDFSRSRLAEMCEQRGKQARFGEILKRHQGAYIACDAAALVALILFLSTITPWLGFARLSDQFEDMTYGLCLAVVVAVVALLGRLVLPWTVARVAGESFICRAWPVLRGTSILLTPLIVAAWKLDRFVHRLAGVPEPGRSDAATLTEEIRTVVDEGQREGLIEAKAGTMIQRVIELHDEDIGSVMTPRTDMITLRADATIEEARKRFIEAGHSRVPVVGESVDDIIGVLYAKDLLNHLADNSVRDRTVRDLVREAFYVPITTGVDTVLETMKRERNHLAVVVDEYGGVAGLVTLEDVLEEIVGDIVDEYDPAEETGIVRIAEGTIEAEGWVHLDDLNEEFELEFPEDEDFDTLAGFVVNELARVPEIGEQFTWRNLRLTITEADRRKVNKVRIVILQPQPTTTEE